MRILPAIGLILAASCAPPLHPDYAGVATAYERSDTAQVVRNVIDKKFGIERETPTEFVSAWKPLYDKDDDVHYRIKATAKVNGAGPYTIDVAVTREDKEFVAGHWRFKGDDPDEAESLRKEIHRALGR